MTSEEEGNDVVEEMMMYGAALVGEAHALS